jgi:ParB family chromosome partitioning protein
LEKRGLGKGLGALIPGASREERAAADVAIDQVALNPYQPRKNFDDERFQELVRSVRLHGVLQPIVVRAKGEGQFELVAGERRLRAAKAVGLSRIPAVVKELSNEQSLEVALIENLQREDIGPMEAAVAYKRLGEEFNLTQDEIAFRLGKSRSGVANTMRLLNLPSEIQDSLAASELSEGHGRALLSIADPELQRELWRQAVDSQLTVREVERLCKEGSPRNVSRETSPPREATPEPRDPNLVALEDQLRQMFGTRVHINVGKERGKVEIEFYTEDDLTRILGLLGAQ